MVSSQGQNNEPFGPVGLNYGHQNRRLHDRHCQALPSLFAEPWDSRKSSQPPDGYEQVFFGCARRVLHVNSRSRCRELSSISLKTEDRCPVCKSLSAIVFLSTMTIASISLFLATNRCIVGFVFYNGTIYSCAAQQTVPCHQPKILCPKVRQSLPVARCISHI